MLVEEPMLVEDRAYTEFAAKVHSCLVEGTHPQLISSVHSLGVLLDSLLMLSYHIVTDARKCFLPRHLVIFGR